MKFTRENLAVLLTVVLVLTGCGGTEGQAAPELQEPVSRNSACQPVEIGKIGNTTVLMATVTQKEYAHFYKTDVVVEDIAVRVGQHVKKGDVLAVADTREAQKGKAEKEAELTQENKVFALQEKIARLRQEELRLSGGKGKNKEIAVREEDMRYEKELHEQRVADLQKAIREEEEKIQAGTLRAHHAGYVTFLKNLSAGSEAAANENIVAVADRSKLYLELTDKTTNDYSYSKYEVKYIVCGGKNYPVKEIPYSAGELALAEKNKKYPAIRLTCPSGAKVSAGDTCLVYFRKKDSPEVLTVGNEALHTQGDEYFVNVRTAEGKDEKRMVTIGEKDDHRTEIREGLKKGEMVTYSSNAAMPVDYGTYTVKRMDFEIKSRMGEYQYANATPYVQLAEREGMVVDVAVQEGDKVKKGDLVCVLDTGTAKAELTELAYQLQKEKESFQDTIKGIREQAASELKGKKGKLRRLLQEHWKYEKELAEYTHTCTIKQMEDQLEAARKGNDGNGRVCVYAEHSGTIEGIPAKIGNQISEGSPVMTVRRKDKTYLLVFLPGVQQMSELEKRIEGIKKTYANVGEEITVLIQGKQYKGVCTGYVSNEESGARKGKRDQVYLATEGKKSYLSWNVLSDLGKGKPGYYMEMENEADFKKLASVSVAEIKYSFVKFQDALQVPSDWVHEDTEAGKEGNYYVWRLTEGELVKQYVNLDNRLNDGANQVIFSGLEPGDMIAG